MTNQGIIDPRSPEFMADPYPFLRAARDYAPAQLHEAGAYMVFRYDDVKQVLNDRALSSSERYALDAPRNDRIRAAGGTNDYLLRPAVAKIDPPEHSVLRKVLARPFTPKAIVKYEARTEQIVQDLLAEPLKRGGMEFVTEFGQALPYLLVCHIFGIPPEPNNRELLGWISQGMDLLSPFLTVEETKEFMGAQRNFAGYLAEIVQWKRKNLGDDVLSDFITSADDGGPVPQEQVTATVQTLFLASFDTTVNQLGNSIHVLMQNRDQWDLLVREPERVDAAVEELLRYVPTAQFMIRTTPEDYEIAGMTVPAGQHIVTWLASGNRDERQFGLTADALDITRTDARQHVTFGHGPHACLGAWLARLEMRLAFRELIKSAPDLHLADEELEWKGPFIRGPKKMNVLFGGNS